MSALPEAIGGGAPEEVVRDRTGQPAAVRPYCAADREVLLRFYEEFEPKRAAQGLPPLGTERIVRWLDSILPRGIHLLAWRAGDLLGHALVAPTERPGVGEYAVFLRQDVRGRGLGTELNRLAIVAAREAGMQRIWLSVEPHNRAAIRSYEKAGFRFLPGTIYTPEAEMELVL